MTDGQILILWSLYLTVLLWAPVVGPNPLVVRRWVHVSREFRAVDRNIVSLVGIVP